MARQDDKALARRQKRMWKGIDKGWTAGRLCPEPGQFEVISEGRIKQLLVHESGEAFVSGELVTPEWWDTVTAWRPWDGEV